MKLTKKQEELKSILEYYSGFHGTDETLIELFEQIENLFK